MKNGLDETPLMCAIKNENYNVINKLLYNSNIDINIQNNIGDNALIYAVKNKMLSVVEQLLNCANIDLNIKNNIENTALMYAVINNDLSIIIKLLNNNNIDINIENNIGYTPYTYALKFCNNDIISLFQSFLNKSNTNYLILSICDAVHNKDYPTISNLLLNKCDIDVKDSDGYTPFLYAIAMNDITTINLFINIVGLPCFEEKIKIEGSIYNAPLLAGFYNHHDLRSYLEIKRLELSNINKK
jgi:ankyrin repeat protein